MDISANVGALLSTKDEEEVKNVRKAAYLVSSALNNRGVKDIEGGEWGGYGASAHTASSWLGSCFSCII